MPVNITIRAVPDDVRDELAARAARDGRSLQEYLSRELVELAARPSATEAILRARMRAAHFPSVDADAILDDVAADRR
ncbi:hypothetical protein OSC27_09820 [Microbacterium sp. STN6]|uniref:FitA-like ribbon-helix-helix domain-containing protein n=1 Tax=Microbacterium sp. STN6 TaxID=2995588 RepID=UPI00226084F5|nr:hypothetical protein [Microbacterium sp. STN6]MCX7522570.1 hypothetical protein [Microbacterium sp. STN6]